MSKNDVQEPQFSDEEIETFYNSMDAFIWKADATIPLWLWYGEGLANAEEAFKYSQGGELLPSVKKAFKKLRAVVAKIRGAFKEDVGEVTAKVLREYYQSVEDEWADTVALRKKTLLAIKARAEKGYKSGHVAYADNWLNYWDDRWLERRSNDKGWVYSTREIIQKLPFHIVFPDQSTISRYRTKLFKSS